MPPSNPQDPSQTPAEPVGMPPAADEPVAPVEPPTEEANNDVSAPDPMPPMSTDAPADPVVPAPEVAAPDLGVGDDNPVPSPAPMPGVDETPANGEGDSQGDDTTPPAMPPADGGGFGGDSTNPPAGGGMNDGAAAPSSIPSGDVPAVGMVGATTPVAPNVGAAVSSGMQDMQSSGPNVSKIVMIVGFVFGFIAIAAAGAFLLA